MSRYQNNTIMIKAFQSVYFPNDFREKESGENLDSSKGDVYT